jgi:hypothetical protein
MASVIVDGTTSDTTSNRYALSVIENPYAGEAEARWASEYQASVKRFGLLSDAEQAAAVNRGEQLRDELAELFTAGAPANDELVQLLIASHYDWICLFWTPNREQYIGLGQMYGQDPRFTEFYDKKANGLADFIGEAIRVWSENNL